jgi:hypothetical protein
MVRLGRIGPKLTGVVVALHARLKRFTPHLFKASEACDIEDEGFHQRHPLPERLSILKFGKMLTQCGPGMERALQACWRGVDR